MKYASLGSVSHGTLRPEDLLAAFADELEWHVHRNAEAWIVDLARRAELLALVAEAETTLADTNEGHDLIDMLQQVLNDFAPPYCYFGAHEGDGSDFGFWPCIEEIDALPEHAGDGDYKTVNDHGNVTVYGADGQALLEIV